MKDKKQARLRRAKKLRAKISRQAVTRLSVHRTAQHIYAQVIDETGSKVLAATSTLDAGVKKGICLLYTSPSPRDLSTSRMPSSA